MPTSDQRTTSQHAAHVPHLADQALDNASPEDRSREQPSVPRGVAHELASQLVTALDRLARAQGALPAGSPGAAPLERAVQAVRRAAELAGQLSALAVSPAPATEASGNGPDQPPHPGPPTILLVDDDEFVRGSVAALLMARRVRVIAAAGGREAIDLFLLHSSEIDAVVLDMNMPCLDGSAVLRELRAIQPEVKVVLSTGGMLDPTDPHLDACNRLAFAHKSLGPQELLVHLERLLERKL